MGGAPLSWKWEVIRTSFSVYPPIKPSHTTIEKKRDGRQVLTNGGPALHDAEAGGERQTGH